MKEMNKTFNERYISCKNKKDKRNKSKKSERLVW